VGESQTHLDDVACSRHGVSKKFLHHIHSLIVLSSISAQRTTHIVDEINTRLRDLQPPLANETTIQVVEEIRAVAGKSESHRQDLHTATENTAIGLDSQVAGAPSDYGAFKSLRKQL
jgi:hypothetical protein